MFLVSVLLTIVSKFPTDVVEAVKELPAALRLSFEGIGQLIESHGFSSEAEKNNGFMKISNFALSFVESEKCKH